MNPVLVKKFDYGYLKELKKGQKFFIVNLESVSLYSPEQLKNLANSKNYKKTPFLYLISSYSRNQALAWADMRLKYKDKKHYGSWIVYCFEKE